MALEHVGYFSLLCKWFNFYRQEDIGSKIQLICDIWDTRLMPVLVDITMWKYSILWKFDRYHDFILSGLEKTASCVNIFRLKSLTECANTHDAVTFFQLLVQKRLSPFEFVPVMVEKPLKQHSDHHYTLQLQLHGDMTCYFHNHSSQSTSKTFTRNKLTKI